MSRFRAFLVLGVLLFCAATALPAWAQSTPQVAPLAGTGTAGTVPLWLDSKTLGNSSITQGSDGSITVGANARVFGTLHVSTSGTSAVFGNSTATSGTSFGVLGLSSSSSGVGVQGYNNSGTGVVGLGAHNGVFGRGIGTAGYSFGVQGECTSSSGCVGVQGSSNQVALSGINQTCDSSGCVPTTGTAGQFSTASGGTLLKGNTYGGGSWQSVFRVDSTGGVFADGGFQASGADFAESVAVAGALNSYEPGDLLIIDPSGNRRLALSQEPYSTLVAGIYSTKPGLVAGSRRPDRPGEGDEIPLAVVGIVPCKATTENGPIGRGDLLVTSSLAGYAMRGTERGRMLGAVIGKALEPLPQGKGVIQVLVTLQ